MIKKIMEYKSFIPAILCFLLILLKNTFLKSFIIPKISLDSSTLVLLGIAVLSLIYTRLIDILKKFKNEFINVFSMRLLIVSFCIFLILLKIFLRDKEILIDSTTIYLMIIAAIVASIPEIKYIIQRIKTVKKGDFELQLTDLQKGIEEVEENKDMQEEDENYNVNYNGLDDRISKQIVNNIKDPNALVLILGQEIERRIRLLAEQYDFKNAEQYGFKNAKYLNYIENIRYLCDLKVIGVNEEKLLGDFRKIRNRVVHSCDDFNRDDLYTFVDLGIRILKLLPDENRKG